jgi:hypothetical protein
MKDQAVVADGYVDANGNPAYSDLTDAIVAEAVALPNSNGTRLNPNGTLGSILLKVLPNLKVTNFANLEEEAVYDALYGLVSRTCQVGVTSKVQAALAVEGLGRVACRGYIPLKGDKIPGIWISDNAKAGGPIDTQFDQIVEQWAKKSGAVIKWGDMAVRRQPKFSKVAVTALESHQKEVAAAIASFKSRALGIGAAANAMNGNGVSGNVDADSEEDEAEAEAE